MLLNRFIVDDYFGESDKGEGSIALGMKSSPAESHDEDSDKDE